MRTVIFTGGTAHQGRFTRQAIDSADLIIAADSGGRAALDFGVLPALVIGDLDSLDQTAKTTLEKKGCQFIAYDSHKDQTDTELAVRYAIDHQASQITVIGGIEGDRLDHILANIFLLIDAKTPIKFVSGQTEAWLARGPASITISGISGDLLSLIPLTPQVTNVKTSHLKYPLNGENLRQNQSRGISNVLAANEAGVTFSEGRLLLVHVAVAD